ncbi:tRNA (adenine(22)-N(1))-methyltransferase [Amphibacillus cookii]|uniref:tRNA (adenine(22)-N(1))-methyltransferase n=1 Tax=Amphibacillus cookii TaxID=767787 RepID=UPI0019565109|nr:tRNA (adenine(22)-N(1))-methyltransferase TrmK [Amphibacillus cookii]MBM7543213.1 tRNA (adenine22-N1)-methyltransferase [Amphibacillus cookii]
MSIKENILSNRLKKIAQFLPQGAYFADIGSDHAYLPVHICKQDQTARAVAGELNNGPYLSACQHVAAYGLTDRIDVIKGDGLTVITDLPVKQIVVAGMGGVLIQSILEKGKELLDGVERLILQPNVDSHYIRKWLASSAFHLTAERILEEDGHIYEILVADAHAMNGDHLEDQSLKSLMFGPMLLQEKNGAFRKKWERERENKLKIISQIKQAKEPNQSKIKQFELEVKWIEEVLTDE